MRSFKNIMWALALIVIALLGCKQPPEFVQLDSGFSYRILDNKGGDKPQEGDLMKMNMNHLLGDSVIFESDFVIINPNTQVPPELRDVFVLCGKGDSVQIQMNLKQYTGLTGMPLTPDMDSTQLITWNIRVDEVENEATLMDRLKKEQLDKDKVLIEKYIADNNLVAESTDDGVYYVTTKAGNGEYPQEGNEVFVNYTLRLLDSTLVDTSYEDLAKEQNLYNPQRTYGPLSFQLGGGGIIPGWNMGIPKFSKGGKGTLLIPSVHAYGNRSSPAIPANSVLIFDIEITDFK